MKTKILIIVLIAMCLGIKAQNEVIIKENTNGFSDGDARIFNHPGSIDGFMIRPYDINFLKSGGAFNWHKDFGYSTKTKNWYVETAFGIGMTNPHPYKLAVKGSIIAEEIKVQKINWADFVFKKDYNLPTLKEVENHIKEKGHLKDIPSAKEVAENGILIGEMNSKLLQKIEELTLYTIQQEKKLKTQEKFLKVAQKKNAKLELRLEKLEKILFRKEKN